MTFVYICRDCGFTTTDTLVADEHELQMPHHMMVPHTPVGECVVQPVVEAAIDD